MMAIKTELVQEPAMVAMAEMLTLAWAEVQATFL